MQNNVQDLIANLANTVSTDEIKQTKAVATKVRSMYTENGENNVLVMIAHDLEAENF
ncbi:hypothetical protein [Oscillatoria sp. HE19RPO]|uniref:hypothetical protein n=1 Tax=Oscillatoria sp. HE19RPO TaxID=2954806 RepID=UPI0020C35EF5|nr:hypothetical protein [Oscillatoria sp. HE19RPO]